MNAHQVYRQTQAQTAAPGELVVMLYRGAVRFVSSAVEAIENKDLPAAHNALVRAQAIITELHQTLDADRGGDIARNLAALYDFMNGRLIEANIRKDAAAAREVEALLRELLPAWEAAVRQTSATTQARPLVAAVG
jgi:flagellar secretion chaperone FliS